MPRANTAEALRNFDHRVTRIEQILPTLATREDLNQAIDRAVAPLATKAELAAAIATLATKQELADLRTELRTEIREEGERTRRYFDIVAESLRDDIRLLAGGYMALRQSIDELRGER